MNRDQLHGKANWTVYLIYRDATHFSQRFATEAAARAYYGQAFAHKNELLDALLIEGEIDMSINTTRRG
jgi:hypothetical protein